jgi:hypothetical protein
VDWECGNRSVQTLKKMLDRFKQLEVKVFFADNWETYVELIPLKLFVQTKAQTYGWSGIILGRGIGVGGFGVRLYGFEEFAWLI